MVAAESYPGSALGFKFPQTSDSSPNRIYPILCYGVPGVGLYQVEYCI